jgi:predicted nucleic acid-binding protein
MTAVVVDSSVLIDLVSDDPVWAEPAWASVREAHSNRQLVINPVIFAEVTLSFSRIEEAESVLPAKVFRREAIPWEAAFLAGKAYVAYRRRGGTRQSPLPDFFIGAHAAVRGYALLTRDPAGVRSYFPTVEILTPRLHP